MVESYYRNNIFFFAGFYLKFFWSVIESGNILSLYSSYLPAPVAARSKVWVCSRASAEIVGSNPTGGMHVCLL